MIAGGSRTIPQFFDAQLTAGYRLMAQGGDIDLDDQPEHHRPDWRPAPGENEKWREEIVDRKWAEYRGRA